jgi:hypothetical protein
MKRLSRLMNIPESTIDEIMNNKLANSISNNKTNKYNIIDIYEDNDELEENNEINEIEENESISDEKESRESEDDEMVNEVINIDTEMEEEIEKKKNQDGEIMEEMNKLDNIVENEDSDNELLNNDPNDEENDANNEEDGNNRNNENENENDNIQERKKDDNMIKSRKEIYEMRRQLLEYKLQIQQLNWDLFIKNKENEHLKNKIRIQDMIYFNKHVNIYDFINNILEKYYRDDLQHINEWYNNMSDEWGQYLENIPLYEIKNIVHYIQRADTIRNEWKRDFYRIFRNFYESLEIMKEQNIHSFRKRKILDMYREWSKYIPLLSTSDEEADGGNEHQHQQQNQNQKESEPRIRINEVTNSKRTAVYARGARKGANNVIYLNL